VKGYIRTFLPRANANRGNGIQLRWLLLPYNKICNSLKKKFQIQARGNQVGKDFENIRCKCIFSISVTKVIVNKRGDNFVLVYFSFDMFISPNKNKETFITISSVSAV
jgi:hypothetical protein